MLITINRTTSNITAYLVIFEVCIKLYLVKFISEISKYNFLFDLKKPKRAKTKKLQKNPEL